MVYWQISEDPSVDERGDGFGLFVSLFFTTITLSSDLKLFATYPTLPERSSLQIVSK